jgi:hypothetical protein
MAENTDDLARNAADFPLPPITILCESEETKHQQSEAARCLELTVEQMLAVGTTQ